jgi:hypothetical protein
MRNYSMTTSDRASALAGRLERGVKLLEEIDRRRLREGDSHICESVEYHLIKRELDDLERMAK